MYFKPVESLGQQTVTGTVVPFDPMTMAVASALVSIEQKLEDLQQKVEEILKFIKLEKQSKQRGNLNMLSEIMADYKREFTNEKLMELRLVAVQDIKREACHDLIFYQSMIEDKLSQAKGLHGGSQVQGFLDGWDYERVLRIPAGQLSVWLYVLYGGAASEQPG